MKTDALAAQAVADGTLYDAGFADGVASITGGGVSAAQEQADIAAAVAAAVQPLNDQVAAMQLDQSKEDALLASIKAAALSLSALLAP